MAPRSIVPGTVVIVLSGINAGKRAVYVKSLSQGHIAVFGLTCGMLSIPRKHCIATSMKLDVSSVKAAETLEDKLFKKSEAETLKSKAAEVEAQLSKIIKKDALVDEYLNSNFSLSKSLGIAPHELSF